MDSLESLASDSINTNIGYSIDQWSKAIKLTPDSLRYYQIYSAIMSGYMRLSEFDTAKSMAQRLIQFCQNRPTDSATNSILGDTYNCLGIYYSNKRNIDSAVACYKKAIEYVGYSSKPAQIVNIYINVADVYTQKSDYVNSVYYFRKALGVSDSLQVTDQFRFPIYFGLGQAYFGIGEYDLSDKYFREAEVELDNRTLSEKFTFCNNRGNYYFYKGEYANALPWFQKARALVLPRGYKFHISLCDGNLGDIYCKLNQFDSAHYYLDNSYTYFKSINHYVFLYYIATVNAELALKQKNTVLAKQWILQYYKTEGVDPQIIALRNKLIQQYYYKVANYRQAYDYLLRNVQIDDSIRSDRVKSRIAELDMRYRQDTTLLRKNIVIHEQQSDLEYLRVTKHFWISIFVILLLVSFFIILYARKKNDLLQLKHLNQISKLRMESVRNRISPHFVFNVLNHEIISEKDDTERFELRALVKLLRHSLEVTENLCVSLSKELDFVRTYIDIEQKSLGDDFSLQWNIDEAIDGNVIMLPSMIIQIPVENAIKHALRGKNGKKELCVEAITKNDGVSITISDNGVGFNRTPAERKGTGTGLKVIYQTIELLNAKNEAKIEFTISSVDNSNGGTRVSIYIPENYSYEM
ncbi:MAG: histidine kinase [Bacteroidales bacterium]